MWPFKKKKYLSDVVKDSIDHRCRIQREDVEVLLKASRESCSSIKIDPRIIEEIYHLLLYYESKHTDETGLAKNIFTEVYDDFICEKDKEYQEAISKALKSEIEQIEKAINGSL